MPDIFEFPQKGNVPKKNFQSYMSNSTSAWRCECGSIHWFLYTDGRVRCTKCHTDVMLKVEPLK